MSVYLRLFLCPTSLATFVVTQNAQYLFYNAYFLKKNDKIFESTSSEKMFLHSVPFIGDSLHNFQLWAHFYCDDEGGWVIANFIKAVST